MKRLLLAALPAVVLATSLPTFAMAEATLDELIETRQRERREPNLNFEFDDIKLSCRTIQAQMDGALEDYDITGLDTSRQFLEQSVINRHVQNVRANASNLNEAITKRLAEGLTVMRLDMLAKRNACELKQKSVLNPGVKEVIDERPKLIEEQDRLLDLIQRVDAMK